MSLGARIYAELRGDRVIWMIVAILALFSILAVYSATSTLAYREKGGDTEWYLMKHGIILAFGLFLTYLGYLMHYMKYNRAAPWLMVVAVPLLFYTIALGEDVNQARRWLEIPYIGLTFQTSDFAKLALIIFVAREITRHKDYIKDLNKAFMPIIVPILIICGLIAPADLSTALLLLTTCLMMMFIGRVSLKYIGLLSLLWVVLFALLIILGEVYPEVIRSKTWISRVTEFQAGSEGSYDVQQAKIAIAKGEIFGVGPGNSIQRNYIPNSYADFIYGVICEEYGLVGGFLLLSLYILLLFRATALVTKSEKSFGAMLAIGLSLNLVLQALANMAVSVHLVPVTGLTLPMVSMGGTSLLFTCIFFGMILSVSKHIEGVGFREAALDKPSRRSSKSEQSKPKDQSGGEQKGEQEQPKKQDNRNQRHDGRNTRSRTTRNRRQSGSDNRNQGGGNQNRRSGDRRSGGNDRNQSGDRRGGDNRNRRDSGGDKK